MIEFKNAYTLFLSPFPKVLHCYLWQKFQFHVSLPKFITWWAHTLQLYHLFETVMSIIQPVKHFTSHDIVLELLSTMSIESSHSKKHIVALPTQERI